MVVRQGGEAPAVHSDGGAAHEAWQGSLPGQPGVPAAATHDGQVQQRQGNDGVVRGAALQHLGAPGLWQRRVWATVGRPGGGRRSPRVASGPFVGEPGNVPTAATSGTRKTQAGQPCQAGWAAARHDPAPARCLACSLAHLGPHQSGRCLGRDSDIIRARPCSSMLLSGCCGGGCISSTAACDGAPGACCSPSSGAGGVGGMRGVGRGGMGKSWLSHSSSR